MITYSGCITSWEDKRILVLKFGGKLLLVTPMHRWENINICGRGIGRLIVN
jgi:hypothetical protein